MCMLVVGEQLHTHKMQKWLKPSIMNSARPFSLLRISGNREKQNKEPSIFSLLIVLSSVLPLHSIIIHVHNIPDVCTLKCLFHRTLIWHRLALPFDVIQIWSFQMDWRARVGYHFYAGHVLRSLCMENPIWCLKAHMNVRPILQMDRLQLNRLPQWSKRIRLAPASILPLCDKDGICSPGLSSKSGIPPLVRHVTPHC